MYRVCIALVDATRARLFTFERLNEGADTRETLLERADLANPQRRRPAGETAAHARGSASSADDLDPALNDRDQSATQAAEKFARMTLAAMRELIDERPTHRVIICAPPRMLGQLRAASPGLLPSDIALDELPRDLIKLSAADARAELASRGFLPRAQSLQH
jgi:protein required for attachment to host cells